MGRECPNFGNRGFLALAELPALRGMGIGCELVEDKVLASLPQILGAAAVIPIGMNDNGFRHVGRSSNLESLYCTHSRDTGNEATAHLLGIERLRLYYAG